MFCILQLETGELLFADGKPVSFETGQEAAEYCSKRPTEKLQPRKITLNFRWKEREQGRFDRGEYFLPAFLANWSREDHFLHMTSDKSGLLAYTKDSIKGQQDLQTRISISAYGKKYLDFSSVYIKQAEDQMKIFLMENDGLLFATAEEEVKNLYINYDANTSGLRSCMAKEFERLPVHPTAVYLAGDLAIAFLKNNDNRTTARCLVWPERKVYSRVYGQPIIHDLLKKRGYKQSPYYTKDAHSVPNFVGAKLKRISLGHGYYVMPYIDERLDFVDRGTHCELVHGGSGRTTKSETGTNSRDYHGPEVFTCGHCGVERIPGSGHSVHNAEGVSTRWCDNCNIHPNIFLCQHYNVYFGRKSGIVRMTNDQMWSTHAFRNSGFTCQKTGELHSNQNRKIVRVKSGGEQYWSFNAVHKYAVYNHTIDRWVEK